MIKSLTSLRFLFAMCIFLHHYATSDGQGLFPEGFIGVGFFYILSGFIISYNYKQKFEEKSISKREFIVARIARIYPLHFLTFLCVLLLAIRYAFKHGTVFSWKPLFVNIALLQSFIPVRSYYFSFNTVSWSISDELFFYLMFPVLIGIFIKIKRKVLVAVGVIIGCVYFAGIAIVPEQYHHALFYINPCFRIIDFIIGIGVFYIWNSIQSTEVKHGAVLFLLNKKGIATIIEGIAIGLLAVMIVFSSNVPQVYRYASYYWLPIALIILCFALFNGRGGVHITNIVMETFCYCRGSQFWVLYVARANDGIRQSGTKPYVGKIWYRHT